MMRMNFSMLLITTMIQIIMLMIFHRTSRFPLLAVYWVSSWGSLLSRSKQKPSTPSSSSSLTPPFRWLSSYTTAWASPGQSVQVSLSLSCTQDGAWPGLPTCLPTSGLHTRWAILCWAILSTWVLSKKNTTLVTLLCDGYLKSTSFFYPPGLLPPPGVPGGRRGRRKVVNVSFFSCFFRS